MSMHSRIDPHDEIAWGPNGRASAVPVAKIGPNPLNEEPAEGAAKAPAIYEIVRLTKEGGPKKSHSTTTDRPGATAARASCRAASRSESRSPVSPSWPQ
jgi:hypothetical protein